MGVKLKGIYIPKYFISQSIYVINDTFVSADKEIQHYNKETLIKVGLLTSSIFKTL